MIELILSDRCIRCAVCSDVCPDDVFRRDAEGTPYVAHKEDCQTCYLCELFCPVDALYVSPRVTPDANVDKDALLAAGLIGSYRRELGWEKGRPGGTERDLSYRMHEAFPYPMDQVWKRSGL